jgi:hypothetical protein
MIRPSLKRTRIEQKKKVLQLLILSGAIRPADIEPRYRGADILHGLSPRPPADTSRQPSSLAWMDLTALLKVFQSRHSHAPSHPRTLTRHRPARHGLPKRPAAPRAA